MLFLFCESTSRDKLWSRNIRWFKQGSYEILGENFGLFSIFIVCVGGDSFSMKLSRERS